LYWSEHALNEFQMSSEMLVLNQSLTSLTSCEIGLCLLIYSMFNKRTVCVRKRTVFISFYLL